MQYRVDGDQVSRLSSRNAAVRWYHHNWDKNNALWCYWIRYL